MTIRSYLSNLLLGTILVSGILFSLVVSTDPNVFIFGKEVSFLLFYILFFLLATGLSVLSFTWLYDRMTKDEELTLTELSLSVRQGILLGILMTSFMFFQQMRIFFWWDALLLFGAILLVELHFLTREN
jgi:hypothetical protein